MCRKKTERNICFTVIPTPRIPQTPIPHKNEHRCTTGTQVSYPKIPEFLEVPDIFLMPFSYRDIFLVLFSYRGGWHPRAAMHFPAFRSLLYCYFISMFRILTRVRQMELERPSLVCDLLKIWWSVYIQMVNAKHTANDTSIDLPEWHLWYKTTGRELRAWTIRQSPVLTSSSGYQAVPASHHLFHRPSRPQLQLEQALFPLQPAWRLR